jgi:hypothetical protein
MSRRGPLDLLGITHQIKQLRITTPLEHIFDSPEATVTPPSKTANLWMNSDLGIASAKCRCRQVWRARD